MARPIPILGPIQVAPDGGGTFNPLADQPMAARSGDLCMLATDLTTQCQEGPRDEGPMPGTGMGEGGVQDTELVDMWIQPPP